MRILHAVHDYLPDQVAGVEVYTSRLATVQASAADHEVAVLYAAIDPGRRTGDVDGIGWMDAGATGPRLYRVVQNRDWRRFEQGFHDRRMREPLSRVLSDFRPDILHVQHFLNLGRAVLDVADELGIPVVMTLHDQWWACAAGGQRFRRDRTRCDELVADRCVRCTSNQVGPALWARGARQRKRAIPADADALAGTPPPAPGPVLERTRSGLLETARRAWAETVALGGKRHIESRWEAMRAAMNRIDRLIAPSDEIRGAAMAFGLDDAHIERIAHGFDRRDVAHRPLPERFERFGFVGSIVPHKGVHELIDAFNDQAPTLSLDLHGGLGDAPDYVRSLRRQVRHPGIRFRGEHPPDHMAGVYADLDCVVSPSIWKENAPLTVQEAFVAGRPVIATDLGGHRELLARGGGILYPAGDPRALSGIIARCASEPGYGKSLAETIPSIPDLTEHALAIERLYERVLSERSRKTRLAETRPSARRTLFLDRDGVINADRVDYVRSVSDWKPIPGSIEAIARLSQSGFDIVVVSNQSGIARGLMGLEAVQTINQALEEAVRRDGGRIKATMICPHGPDDGCPCRKPKPGLIERARREHELRLHGAILIGDRPTDLEAARAAGCTPWFVRSGVGRESDLGAEWRDVPRFDDLAAAADALLGEKSHSSVDPFSLD